MHYEVRFADGTVAREIEGFRWRDHAHERVVNGRSYFVLDRPVLAIDVLTDNGLRHVLAAPDEARDAFHWRRAAVVGADGRPRHVADLFGFLLPNPGAGLAMHRLTFQVLPAGAVRTTLETA